MNTKVKTATCFYQEYRYIMNIDRYQTDHVFTCICSRHEQHAVNGCISIDIFEYRWKCEHRLVYSRGYTTLSQRHSLRYPTYFLKNLHPHVSDEYIIKYIWPFPSNHHLHFIRSRMLPVRATKPVPAAQVPGLLYRISDGHAPQLSNTHPPFGILSPLNTKVQHWEARHVYDNYTDRTPGCVTKIRAIQCDSLAYRTTASTW